MEPHQLLPAVDNQLEQVKIDIGVGLDIHPVVKPRRTAGAAGRGVVAGDEADA